MFSRNPHLLRAGYAPAADVARKLAKSLSTIHRMVTSGRCAGVKDGAALYVDLGSLIRHFKSEGLLSLVVEVEKLKTDFSLEAKKRLAATR